MKKKSVIKYPSSIGDVLCELTEFTETTQRILIKAFGQSIAEKCRYFCRASMQHTIFTILMPDGMAFSGFAVKNPKDDDSDEGEIIAAGRACGVAKEYFNKTNTHSFICLRWVGDEKH